MSEQTIFLSDDKIFYTVEGEGEYAGYPSVFMRLSMCNLTCKGFASADSPHGCDSFVSWSVKNRFTSEQILDLMDQEGYTKHLQNNAIWKITGGEPLIQQKNLLELVRAFAKRNGFVPRIDFETNATIEPLPEWSVYKATFTTSPKLSNNGDPEEKRYKPAVLRWHVQNGSGFKFVINDKKDLDEVYERPPALPGKPNQHERNNSHMMSKFSRALEVEKVTATKTGYFIPKVSVIIALRQLSKSRSTRCQEKKINW
jgi:organic radical activating enzyme